MSYKNDPRYPYTYAADYIRDIAGYNGTSVLSGTKLSRADASRIFKEIADIIEMDEEVLAKKIADKFLQDVNLRASELVNRLIEGIPADIMPEGFWDKADELDKV